MRAHIIMAIVILLLLAGCQTPDETSRNVSGHGYDSPDSRENETTREGGNASNETEEEEPAEMYNPEEVPKPQKEPSAFSCSSDEDCALQDTSCTNCACDIGIRVDHHRPLNCSRVDELDDDKVPHCTLYCPKSVARCIEGQCSAVEVES